MLKELYPTGREYLIAANPVSISEKYGYLKSKGQAYRIKVLMLRDIEVAYGEDVVLLFVNGWLVKLNSYLNLNADKKLSPEQIDECSKYLYEEMKTYKISEFAYFFKMLKMGDFGDFYGAINPSKITIAMKKYGREREESLMMEGQETIDFNERASDINKLLK